jgi:hypothetical protein
MITSQIADEARIPNPSAWIMSTLLEEIIRDPKDIVQAQTYRLKSTVRVELEGKVKRFNIGEEEDGLMQHHRIHRGLGTEIDRWDILNAQGTIVDLGSKFQAGALYFALEKTNHEVELEGPKMIQIVFRWSRRTIPVQEMDTLTSVLLLTETIVKLRERWELRTETGQIVEHISQFRHRGTYNVQLINERRERSRTIIRRGTGESEEKDYVRILELPMGRAPGSLSDSEDLRDMSCRQKKFEDALWESSRKEKWDLRDVEMLNRWQNWVQEGKKRKLPKDLPSQTTGKGEENNEEKQQQKSP